MSRRSKMLLPLAGMLGIGLLSGCANTLTAVTLPANSPWTDMITGFASTYDDLQAVATGTGILASAVPVGMSRYCQGPSNQHVVITTGSDPVDACPAGYTDLGERYVYEVMVQVSPTFTPGSVSLISGGDGSTALAFSLSRDASSSALGIVAGFSEGTIPMEIGSPTLGTGYEFDNYTHISFGPHDAAFGSAVVLGADGLPDALCENIGYPGYEDTLIFRTSGTTHSITCGTRQVNLTITNPYKSVGDCISDSRKKFCAAKGLKGTTLAACNAAQIGACQATFNVPSRLAGFATP